MMEIVPFVDPGLGNSSYLLVVEEQAVVVDPWRDPEPYLAEVERRGLHLTTVLETHLHADFVSGARELQAEGASLLAPRDAELAFPYRPVEDGLEITVAGLTIRAVATPGHTPEHMAYLVLDGEDPLALFSGGALIPGGVARPDLLGAEHTGPLARAAYRSITRRLLALPDDLSVHPTHGAGSFCSSGSGGERATTIGAERRTNPLLAATDEDAFAQRLLAGLGSFPPYFLELRGVNRAGPPVHGRGAPPLPELDAAGVEEARAAGAELVDVRDIHAFAAGHVPGSLSIPWRDQFAVWLGWLVARSRPLVFVADGSVDRRALVWAARTVGFEELVGEVSGGVEAWAAAGRRLKDLPLLTPDEVGPDRTVLDVRQRAEWEDGHLEDAVHVELGALPDHPGELSGAPILAHCGHGERAMTAASLLARAGHADVAALLGGPDDLAAAGRSVMT